jgi:hypothetical protein
MPVGPATAPLPPAKSRRSVPLLAAAGIAVGAGLLSCVLGIAVGATGAGTAKPVISYRPSPVVSTVTETKTVEVTPSPTAPAPPPAPPAPVINEGTWTVGVDFPAGRSKASPARCRSTSA